MRSDWLIGYKMENCNDANNKETNRLMVGGGY